MVSQVEVDSRSNQPGETLRRAQGYRSIQLPSNLSEFGCSSIQAEKGDRQSGETEAEADLTNTSVIDQAGIGNVSSIGRDQCISDGFCKPPNGPREFRIRKHEYREWAGIRSVPLLF